METKTYTQAWYDAEMHKINDAMGSELHALNGVLHNLNTERADIKQNILKLKGSLCEINRESYNICKQIEAIKSKYNEQKHALYLQRPDKGEN